MATLSDHLILYDAECPMCRLYTKAFVSSGMLGKEGRAPYQQQEALRSCPRVDLQRAVNEIALVNKKTGEVTYGVQSLMTILGNSWPVLKPLFAYNPFVTAMKKLYAFISYNRRVIIPAPAGSHSFAVQPAFRKEYRILFLLLTWCLTAGILSAYTPLLNGIVPASNFYREWAVCGGQILFQSLIVGAFYPGKRWDYLGNMMTVSLAGALLLLPAFLLTSWIPDNPSLYTFYFLAIVGLMFLEHIRRVKRLGMNALPTISWVLYRLIVLWILFKV